MKSQTRLRLRKASPSVGSMLKVDGKSFRCRCGANVFAKRWCPEHKQFEFKCVCGVTYG